MRHFKTIGAVIVFLAQTAWGQSPLDSLLKKLDAAPGGQARLDVLNDVVSEMRERNNINAFDYGKEALRLAEDLHDDNGLAVALENLGWIYYRQGTYAEAFDFSTRALRLFEAQQDTLGIGRSLNNLAAISYERKQYKEAIENFERAFQIATRKGDFKTVVRSLNNISFTFLSIPQFDSAEYYAKLALGKSQQDKNGYMAAFSYRTLGDIDLARGRLKSALNYFDQSLRISRAAENYFIQTSTLHRIGKVYVQMEQYDQALAILRLNIDLAKENGYKDELERTYKLVAEIYALQHQMDSAFQYQSQYIVLHDSLNLQRFDNRISLMQVEFGLEMKEAEIQLLTKNALIQQEEIYHQRVWTYFYVGCLTLVIMVVLALWYAYYKVRKTKAQLEVKNAEIERQADELSKINAAKDKLLSVISHDLRSPLASLKGMLTIVNAGDLSQDDFVHLSRQIEHRLDVVYDDMGTVLHWAKSQLQGMKVDQQVFPLRPVVEEVMDLYHESANTKSVKMCNEVEEHIQVHADPNHVKAILRNLVGNAIKFSLKSGAVRIKNQNHQPMVEVLVADEGVGMNEEDLHNLFNPSAFFSRPGTANERGMGVGLLLTKEFVEQNGGAITVDSSIGKGSVFSFTLKKPN